MGLRGHLGDSPELFDLVAPTRRSCSSPLRSPAHPTPSSDHVVLARVVTSTTRPEVDARRKEAAGVRAVVKATGLAVRKQEDIELRYLKVVDSCVTPN